MSYGHAALLATRCQHCHRKPAYVHEDGLRLCTICYKTREGVMHGKTARSRRLAQRYWLDLRGLDKRQQRRAVRRAGRRRAERVAAKQQLLKLRLRERAARYEAAVGMSVLRHQDAFVITMSPA